MMGLCRPAGAWIWFETCYKHVVPLALLRSLNIYARRPELGHFKIFSKLLCTFV